MQASDNGCSSTAAAARAFWNERIVTETRRPTEEILRPVLPQSLATHIEQN